jgi:hypothetical protein
MFAAFFSCPPRMKAGDGNRTHVACLEGRYSTIELHPRFRSPRRPFPSQAQCADAKALERVFARVFSVEGRPFLDLFSSVSFCALVVWSSQGRSPYLIQPNRSRHGWSRIRTCEGIATRFTVWPLWPLGYPPRMEPPPTLSPRGAQEKASIQDPGRAGGGTRTHNPRFTKPMLYRLSYASGLRREIAYHIPAGGGLQVFSRRRPSDPVSQATASAPPARHFIRRNHTASTSERASAWGEKSEAGGRSMRSFSVWPRAQAGRTPNPVSARLDHHEGTP